MYTRKAIKEDCSRLLKLVHELALFEKAPEQVTVTQEHFVESGFGSKPVWEAFVAASTDETGKEIIHGFALWYIRYSTWKGQRLYLEDLIVTEDMRGRGLGKLLLDAIMQEAKNKNYNGVVWQVLDWNEPAIAFYKKYNAVFDAGWLNCSVEFGS